MQTMSQVVDALEEARAAAARLGQEVGEVPAQPVAARFGREKREGREMRQVDAVMEDQRRLEPAIGQPEPVRSTLTKDIRSVALHVKTPWFQDAEWLPDRCFARYRERGIGSAIERFHLSFKGVTSLLWRGAGAGGRKTLPPVQ